MELFPTLGLLGLTFVKEAGLPVPVPGDLLVLGAGIAAASAGPAGFALLVAILVAGFVGGSLQFLLVRGAFRGPLIRVLGRAGVSGDRLETLAIWLRRRGTSGVAVARATPGLRIGAIAASGLAALPFATFVIGLIAGNSLFVGAHFALGFVLGPPALALIAGSGGILLAITAFVVLAVVGGAAWLALRRRRNKRSVRGKEQDSDVPRDLAALGSWAEAACPVCVAVSVVRSDRP